MLTRFRCTQFFLIILSGISSFVCAQEFEGNIRITLRSGSTMEGEKIDYENGILQLYSIDLPQPISIPFEKVSKAVFIDSISAKAGVLKKYDKLSSIKQTPTAQPKPYPLPPFVRLKAEGKDLSKLESYFLSFSNINRKRLTTSIAVIVNRLIEENKLEYSLHRYRLLLKTMEAPSSSDMKLRLLLCACLERLNKHKKLKEQSLEIHRHYPQNKKAQQILEALFNNEFSINRHQKRIDRRSSQNLKK